MEELNPGIIGGYIGSILGILGGLIGTYFSIKNTNGPVEKSFMIKVSLIAWVAIIVFLALLFFLPKPYNYSAWILYGVALPLGINYTNKKATTNP